MTEDEADKMIETMLDEVTDVTVEPDGTATTKRLISDEETLREMEFAEACDAYVRAATKFEKLDRIAKAQKGIPDNLCEWFDALEEQYQADSVYGYCLSALTAHGAAT